MREYLFSRIQRIEIEFLREPEESWLVAKTRVKWVSKEGAVVFDHSDMLVKEPTETEMWKAVAAAVKDVGDRL
jgi:hypothetical protein